MITFVIALLALVLGYVFYGRFVSYVFGTNPNNQTPCYAQQDGIDYIPIRASKIYLIQFLNIAGVGPIFGAIMGAQFGTASYLWIVLGTIFAGATHDYLAAMISLRQGGMSLHDTVGRYLGKSARVVMTFIMLLLLIQVGAIFTSSPAELLGDFTKDLLPGNTNLYVWMFVIFAYYVVATLCPVDKIIGRIYPFFAFCLLFMAVGILGYMLVMQPTLPEIWEDGSLVRTSWKTNEDWSPSPLFPMMFISIACGAISGFHATQSPMMVRCLKNEKYGRPCFYGAMVTEGIVALIWAAAASYFFNENGVMDETGRGFTGPQVASTISRNWLGAFGSILALLGMAAAPISTGDTALRSARLIVADFLHIEQKTTRSRLLISIPIFAASLGILAWMMTDKQGFQVLWRYFGWSNQVLSIFTLWAITIYLIRNRRGLWFLVTFFPAMFMTAVCTTFILTLQQGGFGLDYDMGVAISCALALACGLWALALHLKVRRSVIES